MNMQKNSLAAPSRSDDSGRLKLTCAALLAALILVPTVHSQAEEPPPAKAWSVGSEKGGRLYSMNFEAGSVSDLKRVWMNAFTNDNFLITASALHEDLPAFQMRDMTLPELARSIAFLSQGTLTVEVVERNDSLPGNIWRVARPSKEALSHAVKIRAVAAPRLFANEDTLARFLKDAETAQRKMREISYELKQVENSTPLIGTEIMPLKGQRVFVLFGTEEGISGLESLIKAAEQTAAEPVKETKSGK